MHTPSTSSPLSFFQPVLREFNSGNDRKTSEKEIESEGHGGKNKHSAHQLNKLQNSLLEDVYEPTQGESAKELSAGNSKMAIRGIEASISQSADIKIKTKEGDEITISLSRSATSSRGAVHMEQDGNQLTAYAEKNTFEANFAISIEGNLNQDEQKSLKSLLKKMDKVGGEFFQGDIKSAFKHAQKVGFDPSQIAGFSMDLNMEKSVQAVSAYQQTTTSDHNINKDMLRHAGQFMANAKKSLSESRSALDSISDPRQSFTELFSQVAELNESAHQEQGDKALFNDVIKQLADGFFSAHR